jgi:hypothetical protein
MDADGSSMVANTACGGPADFADSFDDRTDPHGRWDQAVRQVGAGLLLIDDKQVVSPPGSLLATVPAQTTGDNAFVLARDVTRATDRFCMEADVRIESASLPSDGADRAAVILAELVTGPEGTPPFAVGGAPFVQLRVRGSGLYVAYLSGAAAGASTSADLIVDPIPIGEWFHFTFEINTTPGAANAVFTSDRAPQKTFGVDVPKMRAATLHFSIGARAIGNIPGRTAHFDNVRYRQL